MLFECHQRTLHSEPEYHTIMWSLLDLYLRTIGGMQPRAKHSAILWWIDKMELEAVEDLIKK